jgi:hypothetical protein
MRVFESLDDCAIRTLARIVARAQHEKPGKLEPGTSIGLGMLPVQISAAS